MNKNPFLLESKGTFITFTSEPLAHHMDLKFNTALIQGYKSPAQQARILTEDWLARNMYCPICGAVSIHKAESNAPVKELLRNSKDLQ